MKFLLYEYFEVSFLFFVTIMMYFFMEFKRWNFNWVFEFFDSSSLVSKGVAPELENWCLNPTEYLAEQRDTTLLGGSWWPSGWKQN